MQEHKPSEHIVRNGFKIVVSIAAGSDRPRYMACTTIREDNMFKGVSSLDVDYERCLERLMKQLSRRLWKACQ